MMPCEYIAADGTTVEFDLDTVIDVAAGFSMNRNDWTATLIYVPSNSAFVELRSSPQDIRGNQKEEAEEVSVSYIREAFALSEAQLDDIKSNPSNWHFIDMRNHA